MTTDTAAVELGLELDCDVVLKATKVDGVYDKDPAKFKDAKRYQSLTHQQAVENPDIKVMDKAAIGLATEHDVKVIVFNPMDENAIARAANGEDIGTKIG